MSPRKGSTAIDFTDPHVFGTPMKGLPDFALPRTGWPVGLTLNQFIARYKGTRVTYNGRSQCVALAEVWAINLRKSTIPCNLAYEMFYYASSTQWRKVLNTPTGIPPAGSIVVFREYTKAGHVCIARGGSTTSTIYTFDQNWSWSYHCTLEHHAYTKERIIGWLIPR